MRPLPEQAVHLPFESGPYRMTMDLVSVPEADWFEFDRKYRPEMAEKRRLLASAHQDVFAATPASAAARHEALTTIVAALTKHHPDWFSRDGAVLRNHLTEEAWDIPPPDPAKPAPTTTVPPGIAQSPTTAVMVGGGPPSTSCGPVSPPAIDPLEIAGRLVQEDLCLIQNSDDGPIFTAAVLCFPSRWRLLDKVGKPLSAVHGPVPFYADRLARPVDRFMRHVKPGHIASRLNWSLLDDPALFQPGGKWRVDGGANITAQNAGSRVFLRVERQTLRRLPVTGAVLFGIRVHVYPLGDVIDRPDRASALAGAVRALPQEIRYYKSLLPFHEALLAWLINPDRAP